MSLPLEICTEVERALSHGEAVVALESTLITHGLPYPTNVETALAMESAVRESGATPATIAVLDGSIRVGISAEQIGALALAPQGSVRKCSRRDLPIAVALKQNGATTVAGTMIAAEMVGIRVFATGGIGGVHRGKPEDVSADLIELGRTPVAVVCSGAKSILDLPRTLEVLETHGVPTLGYRTDELPAFYAVGSGLPVDQRVDSVDDAARIIQAAHELRARHGILVTVPVPKSVAMEAAKAEDAIAIATREADAAGISGSANTPFVLSRVSELTGGKSMQANIALLLNNARVAGEIACALSQL